MILRKVVKLMLVGLAILLPILALPLNSASREKVGGVYGDVSPFFAITVVPLLAVVFAVIYGVVRGKNPNSAYNIALFWTAGISVLVTLILIVPPSLF